MRDGRQPDHRHVFSVRHVAMLAALAVIGSGVMFSVVTGTASASRVFPPGSTAASGPLSPEGPDAADFAAIRSAQPDGRPVRALAGASTGTFTPDCGRDKADGTTCAGGDGSTYSWPGLRIRSAESAEDTEDTGNPGTVLLPSTVSVRFGGNPAAKVTAMPDGLRIITGDARAFTRGTANARARWTCTGSEPRVLTDKYPLCPSGSQVVRILDLPSCWDGVNADSAGHRAHIVFPDADGSCPQGTRAVPQLRIRLTYQVRPGTLFAVDSLPGQRHKPVTDHAGFTDSMPAELMNEMVSCINEGRHC